MSATRIATVVLKDLRTGSREPMATYMLLSPVLLALAMRLAVPLIAGSAHGFAVAPGLDPALVAELERQGSVRRLPDRAAVAARVDGVDDLVGVVPGPDGRPEVLLQGNEPRATRRVPGIIVEAHARGIALPEARSSHFGLDVRAVLAALTAFSGVLLAGLFVGFTILEEKEQGLLALVAASPLRFGEYLAAKLLTSTVLGLALATAATALVMDGAIPWGPFAGALLVALPSSLLLGLIVGTFANTQLAAIAMLKILMIVFTSLPVVGFAVQGTGWAWTVAAFGNHWAVQGLYAALSAGRLPAREALWTLGTSLPPFAAVVLLMARRLGFRPGAGPGPDDRPAPRPGPPARARPR
ncbi:MAG: ABC transporter permease [Sandaracinaceae bacterium]